MSARLTVVAVQVVGAGLGRPVAGLPCHAFPRVRLRWAAVLAALAGVVLAPSVALAEPTEVAAFQSRWYVEGEYFNRPFDPNKPTRPAYDPTTGSRGVVVVPVPSNGEWSAAVPFMRLPLPAVAADDSYDIAVNAQISNDIRVERRTPAGSRDWPYKSARMVIAVFATDADGSNPVRISPWTGHSTHPEHEHHQTFVRRVLWTPGAASGPRRLEVRAKARLDSPLADDEQCVVWTYPFEPSECKVDVDFGLNRMSALRYRQSGGSTAYEATNLSGPAERVRAELPNNPDYKTKNPNVYVTARRLEDVRKGDIYDLSGFFHASRAHVRRFALGGPWDDRGCLAMIGARLMVVRSLDDATRPGADAQWLGPDGAYNLVDQMPRGTYEQSHFWRSYVEGDMWVVMKGWAWLEFPNGDNDFRRDCNPETLRVDPARSGFAIVRHRPTLDRDAAVEASIQTSSSPVTVTYPSDGAWRPMYRLQTSVCAGDIVKAHATSEQRVDSEAGWGAGTLSIGETIAPAGRIDFSRYQGEQAPTAVWAATATAPATMPVSFRSAALPSATIPWPARGGRDQLESTAGGVSAVRLRRSATTCVEPAAPTSAPAMADLLPDRDEEPLLAPDAGGSRQPEPDDARRNPPATPGDRPTPSAPPRRRSPAGSADKLSLVAPKSAKLASMLRDGIAVQVKAPSAGRVALRATIARSAARRLGLKARGATVEVARTTTTAQGGGSVTMRLRSGRAAAKRLRRARRVTLSLNATQTRQAAKTLTATGQTTLRR